MYNYSFQQYDDVKMARAAGVSLPISMKQTREICQFIKHKSVQKVKDMLSRVAEQELPVPYTRFNRNVAHKPGIAGGRYPMKAAKEIQKVVENAEANAQFKGLNVNNLVVVHAMVKQAAKPFHYGRIRGRQMKRAHVEVVVQEMEAQKREKKGKQQDKQKAGAKQA